MKHFFDQIYYPCLDSTRGRLYGLYIHGNEGTEGAIRAIETTTGALGWEKAFAPVDVKGTPTKQEFESCWEVGATIAASLMR